jgi:flavin-dependent dehydrogenase
MTEFIDCVVVGAGPAGLRAAEVLGDAAREVLVLERNDTVGPKTCAGGLTPRAYHVLAALGAPGPAPVRAGVTTVSFRGEPGVPLDGNAAIVRTVSRHDLGQWQLARVVRAGADVRTGVAATRFDFLTRTLRAGTQTIRYRHLIGADGSTSAVRRALGLPSPRAFFAGEFNVAGRVSAPLQVAADAQHLANGYWWLFPHAGYTSVGAGAPKHLVAPARLKRAIECHALASGIGIDGVAFEGATLEVAHYGCDFPHDVHLVGDAAGLPSPLTGEGIYPALVSGEEVARAILEPGQPRPAVRAWLQVRRVHNLLSLLSSQPRARAVILSACAALARTPRGRRWLTTLFMGEPNGRVASWRTTGHR